MTPAPAIISNASFFEEPANYVFDYSFLATGAGAPQDGKSDYSLSIDKDSDFLLTRIYGINDGAYKINFALPAGRRYANALLSYRNLVGTATTPVFVGPNVLYRAGSRIAIDLLNDFGGSANTIQLIFSGIKRFRSS